MTTSPGTANGRPRSPRNGIRHVDAPRRRHLDPQYVERRSVKAVERDLIRVHRLYAAARHLLDTEEPLEAGPRLERIGREMAVLGEQLVLAEQIVSITNIVRG